MKDVVQRRDGNKREVILFCLSYKGTINLVLNKERVMDAVKRGIILEVTPNAPQVLTLFGKGPLKFGRKESENGAKGQEKGQAKGKAKESPPKETWEGVVLPRIARRKLLAQTGQGVMASASMAPIVDIPTTVLKQGIKGRMRLFFSQPRRERRRESNYHRCS
jgi:hypothetical protein